MNTSQLRNGNANEKRPLSSIINRKKHKNTTQRLGFLRHGVFEEHYEKVAFQLCKSMFSVHSFISRTLIYLTNSDCDRRLNWGFKRKVRPKSIRFDFKRIRWILKTFHQK
ncbi:hypothetical protein T03_12642 [Trichinella britovi]|uniref:Uncharacterized protein n=1 Tax=Trichinella britovi TaxID=45882 RepID=A0A0V1D607_TRIBR|nr:hypothetical protein T03_12642 [Trichinella britovi]